jgi:hypothetical protein
MLNTDDLKQIQNLLEPIKQNMATKNDLQEIKQALAQTNTALEALATGQAEIKETMATKADAQDIKAALMKKANDYERRISNLEEELNIPHPHKH